MFYYLYKITNLVNNKIYIGVHKTAKLNDRYMGSGKVLNAAIKKYGLENFKKEILEFFESDSAMFFREKEIVNEDFLLRQDTYNLRRGGNGGFDFINKNKELVKQRNKKVANNRNFTNQRNAINQTKKTEAYRKNMSESQRNRFKESPGPFLGKTHSASSRKKMSCANKGQRTGQHNSQFGTMWITNGIESKKISKDSDIPNGWYKGRKIGQIS